jgi:hypothetical protein
MMHIHTRQVVVGLVILVVLVLVFTLLKDNDYMHNSTPIQEDTIVVNGESILVETKEISPDKFMEEFSFTEKQMQNFTEDSIEK